MKIKYQQFILLLSTTLLICFLLSFVIYRNQKEALLKEVYAHLESVSAAKENRITGIIRLRYELLMFPATDPAIISNLRSYLKKPRREYQKNLSYAIGRYVRKIPGFQKMYILSPEGVVIASNDPAAEGADWSDNENFTIPLQGKKHIDGLHYNEKNEIGIYLASPLYDQDNLIGVIILDKNASEILSLTQDYSGLGKTGETVLVKKFPDKILFLTPLRNDPEAALRRTIYLTDSLTASVKVGTMRKDTLIVAKDYRGRKVIASGRYIAETDWGLVTKIDYDEALASVHRLKKFLFMFNALGIVVSLIVAFLAGRYFARPVEELVASTNRIKQGDLGVQANEKTGIAELNNLAVSFNEMTRKLERKIEQLDRYAYVISHDLKSPLNNFEGLLNILEDEYGNRELDLEAKGIIEMMKVKINDMREMIDNLLKTAKEEKKIKEPVDLFMLVHEVVATLNPPKNFHIFIQHNLPAVMYHRASMLQIMQNLLSNAIKYMDKEHPLIRVGGTEYSGYYRVCVSDNGPGIPGEKHEIIFNSFEIAHTNKSIDSHGLGLSIVKQLVEESGGKIWVESEEGAETRFFFTIPV